MDIITKLVSNHDESLERIQKFIDEERDFYEHHAWKIEDSDCVSLGRIVLTRIDGTNVLTPSYIMRFQNLDFKWEGCGIDEKNRLYVTLSYNYNKQP